MTDAVLPGIGESDKKQFDRILGRLNFLHKGRLIQVPTKLHRQVS